MAQAIFNLMQKKSWQPNSVFV